MKSGTTDKTGKTSIVSVIKKAAAQNRIRNQLLGRWHRDILSPDWTYERVVALPMVQCLPPLTESLCVSCEPYVLDRVRLEKGLEDWLAGQPAPHPVDHQYTNLLTRNQFNIHLYCTSPKLVKSQTMSLVLDPHPGNPSSNLNQFPTRIPFQ